jgi:uncharacterized protein
VTDNQWTWDEAKNASNKAKHGITFETASLVFQDPLQRCFVDPYEWEERWQTYGLIQHTLVVVVHTEPVYEGGQLTMRGRIISARKATYRERKAFEDTQ